MVEPYEFGARVRAKRIELGLKVREAATRLGISTSRLAALERGRSYSTDQVTRPSRELVETFARVYSLPLDLLLACAGYECGELAELDAESRQLLLMFNSLPPDRRFLALEVMAVLAKRSTD